MRLKTPSRFLLAVAAVGYLAAQVIEFESGGLKYQALTRNGVTLMVAPLPSQVRDFAVMQVAVSNGSAVPYKIRPEDFLFIRSDGAEIPAVPARTVVSALVDRGSRGDVMRLIQVYEGGIYGNTRYRATNGYEYRRQSAMAELGNTRLRAAAAASAVALVETRLAPGESTDGAVFYRVDARPLGSGTVRVRAFGATFEYPVVVASN